MEKRWYVWMVSLPLCVIGNMVKKMRGHLWPFLIGQADKNLWFSEQQRNKHIDTTTVSNQTAIVTMTEVDDVPQVRA